MSLSSTAARGGGVTISIQLVRFAVQLGGLVLLGRLLPPADFGLIVMVTAITGIGDVIRDFGLSSAAVQAKKLTPGQSTNLFWINSSIGLLLAVIVLSTAPIIANLYDEPRLIGITMVLSATFLFNGVQTQVQALLTRRMQYVALSTTDLAAQVGSLLVSAILALAGFGYWSLVVGVLVQSSLLLALRARALRWIPGLPSKTEPMRDLLVFGRNLVATQLLVYASSNVDAILVGARFGPAALGQYKRAYQILSLPLNQLFAPLTAVALPVLASLQDDRPRYLDFVKRGQLLVLFPAVILFSALTGSAGSLIPLVLGAAWTPTATLFQVMAVGGLFQATNYVAYWIFLSLGLTGSHLRYSLVARSGLLVAIVIGVQFGPIGAAAGYSVGTALAWPLAIVWLSRNAQIPAAVLLPGGARLMVLAFLGIGAGLGLDAVLRDQAEILSVIGSTGATGLVLATLVLSFPPLRRDFTQFLSVFRHMRKPRTADPLEESDPTS